MRFSEVVVLDRTDLKRGFKGMNIDLIRLNMFKDEVQETIELNDVALFVDNYPSSLKTKVLKNSFGMYGDIVPFKLYRNQNGL